LGDEQHSVTPAQAGVQQIYMQLSCYKVFWIPVYTGMTLVSEKVYSFSGAM